MALRSIDSTQSMAKQTHLRQQMQLIFTIRCIGFRAIYQYVTIRIGIMTTNRMEKLKAIGTRIDYNNNNNMMIIIKIIDYDGDDDNDDKHLV